MEQPMILKLSMQHRELEYYQIPSNDDPRLTFVCKGQFWFLMHLYGKMHKWWITPETIEVYDIKVGIHNKLNEYRKIYMY